MENKILEAVRALGGKWESGKRKVAICKTRPELNWGHAQFFDGCYFAFPVTFLGESWVSVTREEFNTYADQWLKQAYMHNAALDLDWDIDNVKNRHTCGVKSLIIDAENDYYVTISDILAPQSHLCGWRMICTIEEFIDYCNENKPCEEVKPEWDGEGVPPVGCRFKVHKKEFTCIGYRSSGSVVGECEQDGGLYSYHSWQCKPVKSPRDKAIDEMIGLDLWATDKEYVEPVYDWIKQLTPEQKREFDL